MQFFAIVIIFSNIKNYFFKKLITYLTTVYFNKLYFFELEQFDNVNQKQRIFDSVLS